MKQNQQKSKIYLIDKNGNKELVNPEEILIEFEDGAKVSIEMADKFGFPAKHNELSIHGYYGDEESNKSVIFVLRPGACNLVRLSTDIKKPDNSNSINNDQKNKE